MKNITRSYSGDYVCNADNGVSRWPVTQIISLDVLCKFQSKLNTVSYFDIYGIKYNDIDFPLITFKNDSKNEKIESKARNGDRGDFWRHQVSDTCAYS